MPKYTKALQKQLVEQARQLFCKAFDSDSISAIMQRKVSKETVDKWVREFDFERSKKSQTIALSEIRNSILESYADLLDGKKPKIKPDEASKYAIAFERFSARKQVLTYMYEAFEILTEQYQRNIQDATTAKAKEAALTDLQKLRINMENVVSKLNNEVLGDERNA